ncbi:MAG: 23S rRNA (pseudouridine(1915)-N(3))-methyltransferase RlmH [Flavobacteriales bacterium]|jgi:23S rRNA (pseudouridine1915-N3)-methyltransferase|nr:23S rRNA (pseudouridine(1915)-N(3))-methyltransferase RlmH [Flavobacteriales bacterium]
MKFKLILIGKTAKSYISEGEQEYIKRLAKYISFEKIVIPDLKNAKKLSFQEIKRQEGELILKQIASSDWVILLDEKGKEFRSKDFAQFIQKRMNQGPKGITFVIGGAYGFSDKVYQVAKEKMALSKMTFSHQMVRMIFLEQLYRAFSILNNEPYHHE